MIPVYLLAEIQAALPQDSGVYKTIYSENWDELERQLERVSFDLKSRRYTKFTEDGSLTLLLRRFQLWRISERHFYAGNN